MPGFEVIGEEERREVDDLFSRSGVLFRRGFEDKRNGVYKVREFEAAFAEKFGVEDALAVTSGTAALRVALAALGVGEGDEIITQSFTFVATVEAIIEARATPICTEIDRTLNMDPADLLRRITPRTKAIIVVHMLGVPCRLAEILEIAEEHGIPVIEDTAWGCGGSFHARPLGTHGSIGTFSFDFAKTMTTGEGGMVVARDSEVLERAKAWHDHGHENNPAVPRWEDTRSGSGFNYRMNEMQGAVGLAQLRKLDDVVKAQRASLVELRHALEDLVGIEWREVPGGAYSTADALVFFASSADKARAVRGALIDSGFGTKILPEAVTWHFAATWDHMPELVAAHGGRLSNSFPHSSELLSRAVALPVSVNRLGDRSRDLKEAVRRGLSA